MTNEIFAFADEFGNNSFDFDVQGSHFIVASVIVRADKLKDAEQHVENVRKKYFQTGEIKSSKVGDNHTRRLIVLRELLKVDFTIYAVAVDKRQLFTKGFQYKKSFYQFLNNLVYKELFNTFPKLILTVDEHGDNNFMRQFKKYVQKKHIPDLFGGGDFGFSKSSESILIQLADFIVGTLGRCFDEKFKSKESSQYLEVLKPVITSIQHYPYSARIVRMDDQYVEGTYNETVATIAIQSAQQFIDSKMAIEQEEIDRVNCAKLLLLYFSTYGLKSYLSTKELMQHLNVGRDEPMQIHYFRTKIIAKLRDAGVLVVSSSSGDKKGYKLPSSIEDMHKFVSHGNSMIIPMISRLKIFRDKIKLASHNEIDIIDRPEFASLFKLLE
ncbi:MAG: DUF3800 domain-containing protein [Chitinophagaceae bacterium]|jgi:hypothetical protein